jgi:hypothetical protein
VFLLLHSGKPEIIQSVKYIQVATVVLSGDIPLKTLVLQAVFIQCSRMPVEETLHTSEDGYTSLRSTLEVARYHENMGSGIAKSLR